MRFRIRNNEISHRNFSAGGRHEAQKDFDIVKKIFFAQNAQNYI